MSKSEIGPISLKERIDLVDVLRGLAVCGILIGNMQWFSGYGMVPPALAGQVPLVDQITHFLVHFFVEGKFYSIFSFLFGFGFALQIALALGIIALVATLWQKAAWKRALGLVAPVGRMALTNYLLQTVVCVIIFYGYGFGQFGKVGAMTATLIALAIFLVQILISTAWLKFFNYGPMEWIWRQLTYGQRLDLRLADNGQRTTDSAKWLTDNC